MNQLPNYIVFALQTARPDCCEQARAYGRGFPLVLLPTVLLRPRRSRQGLLRGEFRPWVRTPCSFLFVVLNLPQVFRHLWTAPKCALFDLPAVCNARVHGAILVPKS